MFEKAGVNISVVFGAMNPEQVKTMRSRGKDIEEGNNKFFATGKYERSKCPLQRLPRTPTGFCTLHLMYLISYQIEIILWLDVECIQICCGATVYDKCMH